MAELDVENRRPLKSRGSGWAKAAASAMARAGVSPDMISAASVIFGIAGGVLLANTANAEGGTRIGLFVGAALAIQLRLVCNLMDGMVAVEHGKGGPAGPIWNELPDRFADAALLVGAGYGVGIPEAGWAAAVLAVLTAYVRELGRGLGFPADFAGPMAKQHRMAVLTAACVISAAEYLWGWRDETMTLGLGVIVAGAAFTVARRTWRLAARLKLRAETTPNP